MSAVKGDCGAVGPDVSVMPSNEPRGTFMRRSSSRREIGRASDDASLSLPSGVSWCLRLPVAAAEAVMEQAGVEVSRDPVALLRWRTARLGRHDEHERRQRRWSLRRRRIVRGWRRNREARQVLAEGRRAAAPALGAGRRGRRRRVARPGTADRRALLDRRAPAVLVWCRTSTSPGSSHAPTCPGPKRPPSTTRLGKTWACRIRSACPTSWRRSFTSATAGTGNTSPSRRPGRARPCRSSSRPRSIRPRSTSTARRSESTSAATTGFRSTSPPPSRPETTSSPFD